MTADQRILFVLGYDGTELNYTTAVSYADTTQMQSHQSPPVQGCEVWEAGRQADVHHRLLSSSCVLFDKWLKVFYVRAPGEGTLDGFFTGSSTGEEDSLMTDTCSMLKHTLDHQIRSLQKSRHRAHKCQLNPGPAWVFQRKQGMMMADKPSVWPAFPPLVRGASLWAGANF